MISKGGIQGCDGEESWNENTVKYIWHSGPNLLEDQCDEAAVALSIPADEGVQKGA